VNINRLSVADALANLRGGEQGLATVEARRRLREFGPNRLEALPRPHRLREFLKELTQFFAIVLWVAAGLSFLAEWRDPGQGMARIGYAIIGVILISSLFSFWQGYRVEQALAALRRLLPSEVQAVRDGSIVPVVAEEIVPGDIVLLAQGSTVPADCRVIEAFGLRVDNATVTGESKAVPRDAKPCDLDEVLRSRNIVLAGTTVVSGRAKAVVFATGMRTEFGRIAHLSQVGDAGISPLRRELAHLSRAIVGLALLIALLFFAVGYLIGIGFWQAFIFAIGIIVAMVPEGLQPTLTLALVLATQRMARRQVLIRHLPAVEALGSTTVICTDKTGTLTQNRMAVKALFLGEAIEVDARSDLNDSHIAGYEPFFEAIGLCHSLELARHGERTEYSGDPMEVALVRLSERLVPQRIDARRLDEMPFDAERLRGSVVYRINGKQVLYCKGAPEAVMPLCCCGLLNGSVCPLSPEWRATIVAAQERMADRGLRVLAMAYRPIGAEAVPAEEELIFAGLVGLHDPPRSEVPEAVRRCGEAGIKVIMVTGDHPRTALAIAREIGLVRSEAAVVLLGEQVRSLSEAQLQLALDAPEIVFARMAAEQKMRIVETLKRKGHVVAVTGDGVNDAPALKSAHIGIAMGRSGSDVAKEAADIVLLDDNFASIVNAIEEGRAVFDNIRKFLTYILAHNVPELIPYLALVLLKVPLAITPLQILAIDMGTDSLTALGLGVERPEPRVMQRPPRPPTERLFNLGVAARAYVFLGLFEAAAAMAVFFFVLRSGPWSYGDVLPPGDALYLQATTAYLSTIVVLQVANVFLCRSATGSVLSPGFLGNRWIIGGVALEIGLILFIDYTPWGHALLGTGHVPPSVWLLMLSFAGGMILLEETRKWIVRRHANADTGARRQGCRRETRAPRRSQH
jgi:calcium-translocating P-type ATPase